MQSLSLACAASYATLEYVVPSLAAAVFAAPSAVESTTSTPRPKLEDSVSAAYAIVSYQAPSYELDYGTVTLANTLSLPPGVDASVGLRVGFAARLASGYCFEGFGALAAAPQFSWAVDQAGRTASWRPSLGLEVGGTTASFSPLRSPTSSFVTDLKASGIYAGIAARPLRFRLSGFTASALGLTSGTMLNQPGRQLRLQIELLQVGLAL